MGCAEGIHFCYDGAEPGVCEQGVGLIWDYLHIKKGICATDVQIMGDYNDISRDNGKMLERKSKIFRGSTLVMFEQHTAIKWWA